MIPGHDYIGVGVGAAVFDRHGRLFFSRRGAAARNEVGTWEFPGGMLTFGEHMRDAVMREFSEEYGMKIEIAGLLGVFNHLLPDEDQHWVSATFVARHVGDRLRILEPAKCDEIGWFDLAEPPEPLSVITYDNLAALREGSWSQAVAVLFRDVSL